MRFAKELLIVLTLYFLTMILINVGIGNIPLIILYLIFMIACAIGACKIEIEREEKKN